MLRNLLISANPVVILNATGFPFRMQRSGHEAIAKLEKQLRNLYVEN